MVSKMRKVPKNPITPLKVIRTLDRQLVKTLVTHVVVRAVKVCFAPAERAVRLPWGFRACQSEGWRIHRHGLRCALGCGACWHRRCHDYGLGWFGSCVLRSRACRRRRPPGRVLGRGGCFVRVGAGRATLKRLVGHLRGGWWRWRLLRLDQGGLRRRCLRLGLGRCVFGLVTVSIY